MAAQSSRNNQCTSASSRSNGESSWRSPRAARKLMKTENGVSAMKAAISSISSAASIWRRQSADGAAGGRRRHQHQVTKIGSLAK